MNTTNTSKKNSFPLQGEASNHETNAYSFSSLYRKRLVPVAPRGGGRGHNRGWGSKGSHNERTGLPSSHIERSGDNTFTGSGRPRSGRGFGARKAHSFRGSPSEGTVQGAGMEGSL